MYSIFNLIKTLSIIQKLLGYVKHDNIYWIKFYLESTILEHGEIIYTTLFILDVAIPRHHRIRAMVIVSIPKKKC